MDGGESSNLEDAKARSVLRLPTTESNVGLTTTSETSLTPNPLPTPHELPFASPVRPQLFHSQNSPSTNLAVSYAILLAVAASTLELLFFLWVGEEVVVGVGFDREEGCVGRKGSRAGDAGERRGGRKEGAVGLGK